MANASGTEVARHVIFQSAKKYAIHGNADAANVKNRAIDMFATKVRYFGPTYSKTEKNKYQLYRNVKIFNIKKIVLLIKCKR